MHRQIPISRWRLLGLTVANFLITGALIALLIQSDPWHGDEPKPRLHLTGIGSNAYAHSMNAPCQRPELTIYSLDWVEMTGGIATKELTIRGTDGTIESSFNDGLLVVDELGRVVVDLYCRDNDTHNRFRWPVGASAQLTSECLQQASTRPASCSNVEEA